MLQRVIKEFREANEMRKSKGKSHSEGRIDIKTIALSMHIKYAQWRKTAQRKIVVLEYSHMICPNENV